MAALTFARKTAEIRMTALMQPGSIQLFWKQTNRGLISLHPMTQEGKMNSQQALDLAIATEPTIRAIARKARTSNGAVLARLQALGKKLPKVRVVEH